jgi:serine protease Do
MRNAKYVLSSAAIGLVLSAGYLKAGDLSVLQQTGSSFKQIAKDALPAVVFVDVATTVEVPNDRYHHSLEPYFGWDYFWYHQPEGPRKYNQRGQGSGFIISKDGYILTNNHVVDDADRITVTLADGRKYDARLVGTDPKSEVALIKIDDDKAFPFLELGDSDALEVGEWVLAAGNPFGLSQTITAGIVSAKERSEVGIAEYGNFIQTDAAINPGNSGGPLLNIHGEVVGINTAIYSETGGYMGIGFAIPINQAVQIKKQLIEHGKVFRSVLGIYIQEINEQLALRFDLSEPAGILITHILEGSAAEEAGLQVGDIIVALDGEKTRKLGAFRNRVASTPPNTPVDLEISREGNSIMISAVTKAMEDEGAFIEKDKITPAP